MPEIALAGRAGLLDSIRSPADLRGLSVEDSYRLAAEIRERLVATVPVTGGHLGSNLGIVEITLAVHRVFRSPHDAVVWDTGHQAYVHKLVTGRAPEFHRLRQPGGLSGYPSRTESEHDLVENSHASTALSYADGLAKAAASRPGTRGHVVAVVGDGSLTGGMAWEALNNIGQAEHRPVVVVLNDNGRSYAPTAGSIAQALARLHPGDTGSAALFQQLGFGYIGPVDGHDLEALEDALGRARDLARPVVVHCRTQKGRGHQPALDDEVDHLHSVTPPAGLSNSGPTWTEVLGEELVDLAEQRADLVAVTAAMLNPTGLDRLAARHPERVHDVGIAEQHALTSAAGMAMGGLHPVVCVYATFLNRAFDQVLFDVGLHRLPVTLVLDRAGVTGSDGPSHHGMWDLSLLSLVPGMRVAAPRDAPGLRQLLREAVSDEHGPTALRFPKGCAGPAVPRLTRLGTLDVLARAGAATRPGGGDVLIVPVGPLAVAAVAAAEELAADGLGVTVADPRWVLPVQPELVELAAEHRLVVTVEDNGAAGGYGDAVARALRSASVSACVCALALPQQFLPHGSRADILAEHGLTAPGIVRAVRSALGLATGSVEVYPAGRRQPKRWASAW